MRSAEDNLLNETKTDKPYLVEFLSDVDEFSIEQIKIEHDTANLAMSLRDSGSILIVIESSGGHFEFNGNKLSVKVGDVFFIDANLEFNFTPDSKGDADLKLLAYRAYCDIKSS